MADLRLLGSTSNRVRFTLKNSSTGAPLTGLTGSSSGLIISTIADNEASATAYTQAATHIQTIATLGTFAAPSASNCRFGEVDSTNHPGLYEFQFADARFAVSNAQRLIISVNGAASLLAADYEIELVSFNPFDGVHLGLTAIPNTAVTTNASILTSGTGTDQISVSGGKVLLQATQSGVTIPTVTTVTNQLTAAQIATGVWQDTTAGDFTTASSIGLCLYAGNHVPGAASGLAIVGSAMTLAASQHVIVDSGTVTTVTNQLTAAQIATGVWQDATAGDFTAASSIGKSLGGAFTALGTSVYSTASLANAPTGGSAPTTAQIATAVWQDTTAGDFTVASSIGLCLFAGNHVPGAASGLALVGSNMGTVTTCTNLTNAPTAGDLTATMKASVTTAATAATPTVTLATSQPNYAPAKAGFHMELVNAPNATAITAILSGLATPTNITADSGVVLGATGLDSISVADPGVAANLTTFPKIMVWLFRRFFYRATMTATQVKTYANDGATVNVTQTVSDDGTTQTQGQGS